jgi:hypothetical protein
VIAHAPREEGFMFKRLKYVVVVGFAASLLVTVTAAAQET